MNLFRRYLLILVSGISLIFGIQIPNFVDQYEKRVDAHLVEVTDNLRHYQDIATWNHHGSLRELIDFHKKSDANTFQEEGAAIERMYQRQVRFEADRAALNGSILWKAAQVAIAGDQDLIKETVLHYSYAIPLNQEAVLSGIAVTVGTVMLLEFLFVLLGALARLMPSWSASESKGPLPIAQRREPRLHS
jgi:hypothetical protein